MKCGNRRCRSEAVEGRKRCEKCRELNRVLKERKIAVKLACGECLSCTQPAETGKRRCAACLQVASNYAALKHGGRKKAYRPHQKNVIDEFDIAYVPELTEHDYKLSAHGRCRCGLLLPCEVCLPTNVVDFVVYRGNGRDE